MIKGCRASKTMYLGFILLSTAVVICIYQKGCIREINKAAFSIIRSLQKQRSHEPDLVKNTCTFTNVTIASGITNVSFGSRSYITFSNKIKQHEILWINKPFWINLNQENQMLMQTCPYKNCRMTVDTNNTFSKTAIIFSTQEALTLDPMELQKQRPKDQIWVFMRMEPPTRFNAVWYKNPQWRNTMNWSIGYRLDSDIFWPYIGDVNPKSPNVAKDYQTIFRNKSKFAVWVDSHCLTQSKREVYVKRLKEYGIPIDIFGKCTSGRLPENELRDALDKQYKFYLAFENSFCKDYVTEKFFGKYKHDIIIVVRGGVNYTEHFVSDTFIDTSKFSSIKQLAEFLLKLNNSEKAYVDYLRKKDETFFNPSGAYDVRVSCYCALCMKLNNIGESKVYGDIYNYLQNGTCTEPMDLT